MRGPRRANIFIRIASKRLEIKAGTEQRDQFVRSCMLDFSSGEQEETKFSIRKTPVCLFAFQGGKRSPLTSPALMKIPRHHAATKVFYKFHLNFFPSLSAQGLLFSTSSRVWGTSEYTHLELISFAPRRLCTADNVKLIRRPDSFCSRHTHGVKMLNKARLEFWLQSDA